MGVNLGAKYVLHVRMFSCCKILKSDKFQLKTLSLVLCDPTPQNRYISDIKDVLCSILLYFVLALS